MKLLVKIIKLYYSVEKYLLSSIFIALFIIMILQISSRYVFGRPLIWTDEISTLLQVNLVFLGVGYTFRKKEHVSINFIVNHLSITFQHIISIINGFILLFCLVLVIKSGIQFVGTQDIPVNTVPFLDVCLFYICFPLGCLITSAYIFFDTLEHILILLGKKNNNDLLSVLKE